MRVFLFSVVILSLAPACKETECGTGTIERDGTCQPADETTGTAKCGPFTVLEGDVCVPMFPPTQCDPGSTMPDTDSSGVTTCIGTGVAAGCTGTFACPTPAAGKETICGQLYNLADNSKFAATNATGAKCTAGATSGPCALQILPLDALTYANAPTSTPPLASGEVYIDDCGRYRVPDITLPGSNPFIGLGIDDAGQPFGPSGVTVTTGVATGASANLKVINLEAWVVDQTTVGSWQTTGGPMLANGIYTAIYRTHKCDPDQTACTGDAFANQAGVTITKGGSPQTSNDYYFQSETGRLHIDGAATATSINGSGLYTGASVNDNIIYSGTGGITDTANCQWETHAAASIPGVVFMQVYRPANKPTHTCTQ